jgi:hypothetical protein
MNPVTIPGECMRRARTAHRSLPEGASRESVPYPDGAHIKDPKEVRDILYKMQRPGIAPSVRALFVISSRSFSNADSLMRRYV